MNRNFPTQETEHRSGHSFQDAYRLVAGQVDRLRKARRAIDVELEKAEAALDLLRQLTKSKSGDKDNSEYRDQKRSGKRFHKGSMAFEVVTRAKRILLEAGRPLNRSELLERFNAGEDFTITARDPARFIGRTLWENPEFVHFPKVGYWIVGAELPNDFPEFNHAEPR
ncbi:hypothetical protein FHT86_000811 [Rhizobium sp. BK313]|uniref:hypothetical protein n=1 Tax=Rhizobium sp. BK313 TaxID=2587081 RepID=UPI00105D6D87|nr:hypothetical protein [Rhizobium sp. BK313]MBB3452555.1 hypothetical protein [Rhizobium sp. BK313]